MKTKARKLIAAVLSVSMLLMPITLGTVSADGFDMSIEELEAYIDEVVEYAIAVEEAMLAGDFDDYDYFYDLLDYLDTLIAMFLELEEALAGGYDFDYADYDDFYYYDFDYDFYDSGYADYDDDSAFDDFADSADDDDYADVPVTIFEGLDGTVSVGTVYSILAIAIGESIGRDVTDDPLEFAQTNRIGLITARDMLRYRLETAGDNFNRLGTGRTFDWNAPITRQEYAIAVERMVHVLRSFNIELIAEHTILPYGARPQLSGTEGIVRLEGNAPLTSEHGIGATSSQFRDNVSQFRIGRVGVVGRQDVNAGGGRRLGEFEDGHEVRGSARVAIMSALNWGLLAPKTFDELTNQEAIERALTRGARQGVNQEGAVERQVVLDRGLFAAPNDNLTVGELVALDEAFLNLSLSVESIMALID